MKSRPSVLITGCTAAQVGRTKPGGIANVCTFPHILVEALLRAGYEVENRIVCPGESLARYDFVVVFMTSLNKLGTTYAYGALWALHNRRDAIISFDDWQIPQTIKSFEIALGDKFTYYNWDNIVSTSRKYRGIAYERRKQIDGVVKYLSKCIKNNKGWRYRSIVPAFTWGDDKLFGIPMGTEARPFKITRIDPSALVTVPKDSLKRISDNKRSKVWVLASLANYSKWVEQQDFNWPVEQFGHLKSGHAKLPESEIIQMYCYKWGVIAPKYAVSGSGWWRNRVNYAAMTGCILYVDPVEQRSMPEAYHLTQRMVEGLSTKQLTELANSQRNAYVRNTWSKEQLLDELSGIFK